MKKIILFLNFFFSLPAFSQSLKEDFLCVSRLENGESFEVVINNIEFAREVKFKKNGNICTTSITYISFSQRSVTPQMIIDFENLNSCRFSQNLKLLKKGFIKASLEEKYSEVFVLALVNHQPIQCQVKSFNKQKFKNFSTQ